MRFPDKCSILFSPAPYKILYGGRGSGKSWSIARGLLLLGMEKPERILCTREIHHSIKDSVYQLIVDQIENLGVESFYKVLGTTIRGQNGTTFNFGGLQEHTVDATRSFEGATKVWVEEAQNVRKASWKVLIPTIRTEGREFWISFNPILDTGETYKRFVINPPDGAVVVKMNWQDNPWFPSVLDDERRYDLRTLDEEEYLNIWEGEPMRSVPGAIYARQIAVLYAENRVTMVPYDPQLKVHVVQDLGFSNATAVGFFQRRLSELRCIRAEEYTDCLSSDIAAKLKQMPYNYGAVWLPHDGFAGTRHGQTDAAIYRSFGFVVRRVPDVSVEVGIRTGKEVFPNMWFDQTRCAKLLPRIKEYKRRSSNNRETIGHPARDENADSGDMLRYAALSCRQFYNEADRNHFPATPQQILDPMMGVLGI